MNCIRESFCGNKQYVKDLRGFKTETRMLTSTITTTFLRTPRVIFSWGL